MCRYPHYNYGYGHLNGYGYRGHPYGLGHYGYGHHGYYGKRSAEPQHSAGLPGALPYLHYDLGRKLGYFAYRGYPQVRGMVNLGPDHFLRPHQSRSVWASIPQCRKFAYP